MQATALKETTKQAKAPKATKPAPAEEVKPKRKYTKKSDKPAEVAPAPEAQQVAEEAPNQAKEVKKPAAKNLPVKPEIKVQVVARVSDAPVTLADIEIDINKHLGTVASSAMRVGGLLLIAREFHESTDKFIKWAEDKFSIKKAQVYKLMKVHQEFGQDERLEGVSMRVLYMLTGQSQEVVQKAAALASTGRLDSQAAAALTGKTINLTPEPKEPAKPAAVKPVIEDAEIVTGAQSDLPFDTGASVITPAKVPPASAQSATGHTVEGLLAQIAELTKTIEELTKPKAPKVAAMPMLKQFKSSKPYVVLGLDSDAPAGINQVRAAYRELAAIWNQDSNPEAFKLITEARDALLAEIPV